MTTKAETAAYCDRQAASCEADPQMREHAPIWRERAAQLRAETAAGFTDADKVRLDLVMLLERCSYSDSYGVPGSDFRACHLCGRSAEPGVLFKADWHKGCLVDDLEEKYPMSQDEYSALVDRFYPEEEAEEGGNG